MLKSRGYSAHSLLITFSSLIVVMMIITVFISYTGDIAREARISMLKMTETQLKSTNRMLLSRATILNLHLSKSLDASLIDEAHQGGILTYGEMSATKNNLPIFLTLNELILEQGLHEGHLIFYADQHKAENCSLAYFQPFMENNAKAEAKRHDARYLLNIDGC